jgi:hypothetical protein
MLCQLVLFRYCGSVNAIYHHCDIGFDLGLCCTFLTPALCIAASPMHGQIPGLTSSFRLTTGLKINSGYTRN